MDVAAAIIAGFGLSGAAGLNAYIPLMVVGLLGRFGIVSLPDPYSAVASTPVLVAVGVLLVIEVVADKVPAVDSVNDAVQSLLRPAAGALLFAGSVGALRDGPPWLGIIAGLLTAGTVHAGKAALRPVANTTTAGVSAPVLSTIEDGIALVASLLAVLAPLLLVVFVVVVVWLANRAVRRLRRPRATMDAASPPGTAAP